MITHEQIRKLAQLRDPEYPVTSLFLNLNGGRDSRKSSILLKDLLKAKRSSMGGLERMQHRSVERDFEQIERFLHGFKRKGARALAIFSSSGAEIWEVFPLARRVQDRLIVDTHPHIRPLSRLLNECKRCAVILLARDRATIDLVQLGEIQTVETLSGESTAEVREAGKKGYVDRGAGRRSDDQLQHFAKEVAARALALHQTQEFDYVVLGGSQGPVAAFQAVAHRYLAERIIGKIQLGPDDGRAPVLKRVSACLLEYEEARGLGMMQRIVKESGAAGLGVIGIESTLKAISEGRVANLVVAKGTFRPGVACTECSFLGRSGAACPQCETDLLPVPDVIEEAVDRSIAQSTEVLFVREHEQLASGGGLAALLRYR